MFQHNFNAMSGANYDAIIAAAKTNGYFSPPSTGATLSSMVYGLLTLIGFMYSAYIAGEVKGVQKSQIIAQFGSIFVTIAMLTMLYAAVIYVFGNDFYNSIGALWFYGSSSYPFGSNLPLPNLLATFMTTNPFLLVLISLGLACTPFVMNIAIMFVGVRNVFAWSYDRVLPVRFASVNQRFKTPVAAIVLVALISVVYDYIANYTNIITYYLSYSMFGWFIAVAIVAIAAIAFPFRRKDIYEASPSIVKYKVAGLPFLSILGVLLFIASIITAYWVILPALTGLIALTFIGGVAAMMVLGVVVYYVSYLYQKRRGVPVEYMQKEIPPE
jgi:amino acid transporter